MTVEGIAKMEYGRVLLNYQDVSINKLSNDKKLEILESLTALGLKYTAEVKKSIRPWYISSINNSTAYVVVDVYPGYDVPDYSFGHVNIFNDKWELIGREQFIGGYRMFIKDVSIVHADNTSKLRIERESSGPFIVTESGMRSLATEGKSQVQYMFIVNNKLHMDRTEDEAGKKVDDSDGWKSSNGWMKIEQ